MKESWGLDPDVVFLNHGSFGACPTEVLAVQSALRAELEAEPVAFLGRSLEARLDAALADLAAFVGADPEDLAFVTNATTGVNAVLRSLRLEPGDELLVTDQAYNACRAALDWVAARAGARVVVARLPFPLDHEDEVQAAVLAAANGRTRLALLDHVTSPTGLVLPIARLVAALAERGIDTLVDGAHAPGMVPVGLDALGAAYYAGNCHKWLCAPKGAGFLHVRRDRQEGVAPVVISHGANSPRRDRSRFRLMFGWTGTTDPTAMLAVPAALRFMGGLLATGWPGLMAANRGLAITGRRLVTAALDVAPAAPDDMVGAMAAVPLPGPPVAGQPGRSGDDPLQHRLFDEHRIEVPIVALPPHRVLRISAQIYNDPEDYRRLATALGELAGRPREPGPTRPSS